MSALPPKADIAKRRWDVRFVPKVDDLVGPELKASQFKRSLKGKSRVTAR